VTEGGSITIRMLFVDDGSYHHEELRLPAASLDEYDRLIDGLREEPAVLKQVYLDVDRLCAAWVVED
jgi:hypothetical protein